MHFNPIKCIERMRKKRDYSKPLAYLAVAAVLLGLSAVLGFNVLQGTMGNLAIPSYGYAAVGLGVALIVFAVGIFISWVFSLGMSMLGGKGKFYEGLVSIAYPLKLLSMGIFISALASYAGGIGGVISFLALSVFGILAYTSLFRATREMFRVDMITAFIGVSTLFVILMLAAYGSVLSGVVTSGLLPVAQPSL
jgi:hypothetical protein